jgi:hypothetical protein
MHIIDNTYSFLIQANNPFIIYHLITALQYSSSVTISVRKIIGVKPNENYLSNVDYLTAYNNPTISSITKAMQNHPQLCKVKISKTKHGGGTYDYLCSIDMDMLGFSILFGEETFKWLNTTYHIAGDMTKNIFYMMSKSVSNEMGYFGLEINDTKTVRVVNLDSFNKIHSENPNLFNNIAIISNENKHSDKETFIYYCYNDDIYYFKCEINKDYLSNLFSESDMNILLNKPITPIEQFILNN